MNLGMATSTFTAQNIGAGKIDRVKKGYLRSLIIVTVSCIVTSIVIVSFGPRIIAVFIDSAETSVIAQGTDYITSVSYFYLLMGVMFVANGVLRGSGDMNVSMISTISSLGVRIIAAYSLSSIPGVGYKGIWWSIPTGWLVGSIIATLRYKSGRWTKKAIVGKTREKGLAG